MRMMSLLDNPLFGLTVGGGIGWLLSRLPVGSMIQSVAAALLASVLSSLGAAFISARFSVDDLSVGAVSIDLLRGALGLLVVGVAASALHVMLGWLGQAVHPSFGSSRPVILGAASGMLCALVFGVAVTTIDTLR